MSCSAASSPAYSTSAPLTRRLRLRPQRLPSGFIAACVLVCFMLLTRKTWSCASLAGRPAARERASSRAGRRRAGPTPRDCRRSIRAERGDADGVGVLRRFHAQDDDPPRRSRSSMRSVALSRPPTTRRLALQKIGICASAGRRTAARARGRVGLGELGQNNPAAPRAGTTSPSRSGRRTRSRWRRPRPRSPRRSRRRSATRAGGSAGPCSSPCGPR